ncbi:MAG TPA: DUF2336 domain-containing protein [Rhizomicrobium sp.]|jgi:uncharacterized protein (DUF2336 family)|nr:DUF2336 domain-containing protein [Rhizomicrobium sp.]
MERRPDTHLPPHLGREEVLRILEERGQAAREELAARADAAPEVLMFLAGEGNAAARRAVAANPLSPPHANRLLADDADDEVRVELARKIGRMMPGLPQDGQTRLRTLTIETLEALAKDQLPRVRQVLAEEIKMLDSVPRRVIKQLARDVESVAAPILEYSPLLSDADLIEIITTAQARHALQAIARRRPLGANVSEAIGLAMDEPSVSELLYNSSAEIRQQTLDKIVEHAAKVRAWHLPLVLRSDLSQRAIRRIAGFVSASLIERLAKRHGLDEETQHTLTRQLRARVEDGDMDASHDPATVAAAEAEKLFRSGRLDDGYVEAAAEAGRRETVIAALALLAKVPPETVRRIVQSGVAKAITALVWRAGLSMRAAFKIQTFVMHLPAADLLPARGGVAFPLSEEEMRFHLGYFEVKA